MIDRIKKIMEAEGMSAGKFADEIGIIGSRLSHYLSGRNNVSLDLVMRILERFRGINPEWLMFGRGEMYKSADTKTTSHIYEPNLFDSQPSSTNYPLTENADEKSSPVDDEPDIFDSEELNDKPNDIIPPSQSVDNYNDIDLHRPQKTQKSIDRILVMYTDSTFDCYTPNGHKQ